MSLTNENKAVEVNNSIMPQEEQPKYIIKDLVSANKLKVYIRIELIDREAEVDCKEIFDYLSEHDIVYGIREEEIKSFCKEKEYSKELIAVQGKEPVDGKDAELIYDFDISSENKFIEDDVGTIDFRNLNNVVNVTKDTVLCHIIPAQEGEDGIDVYGNPVSYKKGKSASFNYGSNTHVSEDELKLLASADGCVEYKNGKVYVDNVYKVNNVDNNTGNIDFIGSVVINGDVKEGFSVTAKGDIKIRGMVEGAFIKSDGEVVISKGMNGMGKGTIVAKGNITSKYIENATIFTESIVYAEALINSEVVAKDSVVLRGANAAIIGGTTRAENIISAKTIGSKTNPETNVIIDLNRYQEELKLFESKRRLNIKIEKDINDKKNEVRELDEKVDLIASSSLDNENKNAVKRQLLLKKIKLNNDISDLQRQLTEIMPTDNIENHKIICKGTIYSNTRITIGWMKYRVRQDISYSKVYNDGNDITIAALNPGDIEM
ncbi:FapA family protein [Sedimentibacter sp.]|uniref:DUF342 domain-containing protein n=1 Tax=Sedimentibacter sp. TaxID=1960295 RepID=UPI0028AD4DEA|nr:FapA family protein [Sedimentibacter sp.]